MNTEATGAPLIDVENLSVVIDRDEGVVRPLNGVSFRIDTGQAVGIVGESGCGKTMTSNALLRILPPAAEITSGHIRYRRKLDEQVWDIIHRAEEKDAQTSPEEDGHDPEDPIPPN